jgi:glyoxylase-like metal-dependent hydrolase (beta-lactamase superfamily II)
MLEIVSLTLGPVETNTYLVGDPATRDSVVIDPAADGASIAVHAEKQNWRISAIWLTHAHFDHLAGAVGLAQAVQPPPPVALHPEDLPLWEMQGGAPFFGMRIDPGPRPAITLEHGQLLKLGDRTFEVRHAPGHTPGHVIFYCAEEKLAFCGDVIFWGSIGRTDLPGGSFARLITSIQEQVLSMPDDTRLLSGHGPETTVGQERRENPFLT